MSSNRRHNKEISLQPHVTSVIPSEAYHHQMSPLMAQSLSKAGVGLLENFVIDGWGGSRPNSSANNASSNQNTKSYSSTNNQMVRKPKKPEGKAILRRRPVGPGQKKKFVSRSHSTAATSLVDGEPTLELMNKPKRVELTTNTRTQTKNKTTISLTNTKTSATSFTKETPETTATTTATTKPLSEILPVFQLHRPLPEFHLPSNDRSIKVMTLQFQSQLRKHAKIMEKRIDSLNYAHEIDLANVVLAYDTRTETLENRVNVYKSNGSKLQTMLEQAQFLLRGQRSQVKKLRTKVKMQQDRLQSLRPPLHKGTSIHSPHGSPIIIGRASMTSSPEMWSGLGAGRDSAGSEGRGSFNEYQQHGRDPRDSSMSDWGHNNDRKSSGIMGLNSEHDVDPTEVARMRQEIQQYQEALAEASKTIDTLESRQLDDATEQQHQRSFAEANSLADELNKQKRRASNREDELQTEQRLRLRAETELERAKIGITDLQTENEKLTKDTVSLRSESARVRQEVATSEAKINAQLKGAAIQMKKTLKQCHMLEELIRPEITCNNCFEVLKDAQILYPCGHSFCDHCVDQMERPEDAMIVCQLCQALVPRADTCPNISLQAICPRVAWWSEPISQLKQIFHDFSGKEFVAQQTFAGDDFNPTGNSSTNIPVADARTTMILIRIAGAVKETGKTVTVLFEEFDDDKGGTVDYEELEAGLKSINVFLPPEDFQRLLRYADPNGDGEIEYHEFAELLDHMLTMREGRDNSMQRGAAALDPMVNNARNKGY